MSEAIIALAVAVLALNISILALTRGKKESGLSESLPISRPILATNVMIFGIALPIVTFWLYPWVVSFASPCILLGYFGCEADMTTLLSSIQNVVGYVWPFLLGGGILWWTYEQGILGAILNRAKPQESHRA